MLRGWKLPKFYFLKISSDPEAYEVVDGQQRLLAIFEFFDGDLALAEHTAKQFGGAYYNNLRDDAGDKLDDYEIQFDEIQDATEEDVKEFFQRLQEGLPLTSAEKLNSLHSRLRDFVMKLAKNQFFQRTNVSDRRYGHFDIMAKVASVEIDGIDVGLRYDNLRAVFESQSGFSPNSNVAKRLKAALDFVDAGFDEQAGRSLRNRTIVQSLLTFVCRLLQSGDMKGHEVRIKQFFMAFVQELNKQVELGQRATDENYLEFQRTVNANIKDGARIRQQILFRKLIAMDPAFAEILDPTTIAESGLTVAIASDAAEIVRMIGELNEVYASQHGSDLFKATNRTAQAQAKIRRATKDYDDYKGFIDDLYFLFHESVGTRLGSRTPVAFRDVNILRTSLQHDVDHGRGSKIRTKRKQMGDTFEKYAGTPSPVGLAPERFVLVQSNLLTELTCTLRQLKI